MDADHELLAIFRAEVEEQIDDLSDKLGHDPARWKVDRLFQIAHNVKGAARIVGADGIRDAAHSLEDLLSAVRDGLALFPEVVDTIRAGARVLEASFAVLEGGPAPDIPEYRARVSACLQDATARPAAGPVTEVQPSDAESPAEPQSDDRRSGGGTLRVATERLDALMEIASEFVSHVIQLEGHRTRAHIVHARLSAFLRTRPDLRDDPELGEAVRLNRELVRSLADHSSDALRVSDELQASMRSLRMVRVDALQTTLRRALREACAATGRTAKLRVSGGRTEVDRMVLEQLRDPLVHLIRNAVTHGIESPEERQSLGKAPDGSVVLEARSAGPLVEIVVEDDGRGVAAGDVRERVVAAGLVTAQEADQLGDDGILDLLFLPGASTADTVSELSGRGVGLDVVRSHVGAMGGEVMLQSTPGEATRVVLRVPLTRLTTSGILLRIGDQIVAAPTSDVERAVKVSHTDVSAVDGSDVMAVDGRLVRVANLAETLGLPAPEADELQAVVLRDGARRRAFLVDDVIGQRDLIVQPLCWNLAAAPGVSGAAVLDGRDVVLILDSRQLVTSRQTSDRWAARDERPRHRLLVVDDSATSRTLERNILTSAGYDVLVAVDGDEAVRVLAAERIDLVVADVEMPGLNGFELTRHIRGDPKLEHIPVILVTSLGSEKDRRQGAESGADSYIVKGDFDQDELLRSVARLL